VKQKPAGGGGVEAHDFTVSEGHGHPLVLTKQLTLVLMASTLNPKYICIYK